MADNSTQQAHILNYTGQGLDSILSRANTTILTGTTDSGVEKFYIKPFNGGLGPIDSDKIANHVLLGGTDEKINTVPPTSGAFFVSSEGSAPTYGTLPVSYGGTGETTLSGLRDALGLGEETTDALKVEYGGTGMTTFDDNRIMATSNGAYVLISPQSEGYVLVSNGVDSLPSFKPTDSITKLGTINNGEWKGATIAPDYGGTGQTSLDGLSIALGLNGINSIIPVSRGGTGTSNLTDLKTNLNISLKDIAMSVGTTIPEANGGTGYNSLQTAFDEKITINLASEKINNILPVEKGGTGVSDLQTLANNLNSNLGLGTNTSSAIPVERGGTGNISLAGLRSDLNVLTSEEIDARITQLIPSVRETIIYNNVLTGTTISAETLSANNVIIITTNTNDIVIGLENSSNNNTIPNGSEVKIIKNGSGNVTVNGTMLETKVSTFIYVEGNWYN